MPPKTCTVTFTDPSGIRHSVDVTAESLYEAAILGLSLLKKDGWVGAVAPAARLEVTVREPATTHQVSVRQLHQWVDSANSSPAESLRRVKLRRLLQS